MLEVLHWRCNFGGWPTLRFSLKTGLMLLALMLVFLLLCRDVSGSRYVFT